MRGELGRILTLVAFFATTLATAQPLSTPQLIGRYLGKEPAPAPDHQVGVALAQAHATGYFEGVADLGHGQRWCLPDHLLRGELFSETAHELQAHADSTGNRPAARAVADYFAARYPCAD